ncbi:MAG TPA: sigma 54-interacting transcriptional regulator [Methylomirabilota bacterium]|jgi:DNA-binding NtrC family response regulator/tetratricopeptide (TPR) repeat protein|nr:sigma 54-interacting transcriptional regulator [Methylomirabilota bacterium]
MDARTALDQVLGDSPAIAAVREKIRRLTQHHSDARRLPPILLQGETGTGKGLLARMIHTTGPRAGGPFVDVNCAAIPATLLEAEMFGFERGAFTDARHAKPGLFHAAHRGTIFLDEVGLLPEALQVKLLKAIEEQAVRRLGSTRSEPVDTWVLAATSEDLGAALEARRFREDLYHRLAVVAITLPPLRERGSDVISLAEHFLSRACRDYGLPPKTIAPDAVRTLLAYSWPGNIRELGNLMERVALLGDGSVVTAELLGLPAVAVARGARPPDGTAASLADAVRSVEREHLLQALLATGWNVSHAATRLGISRNTLRYRIEKHGLRPDARRPAPSRQRASPPAVAAEPLAPAPPAPVAVRWEHRHVTLLRAALVAPAAAESPPAEAGAETARPQADAIAELSPALAVLVEKVLSFGGRPEGLSPAGLTAEFGVEPIEDAPSLAAHAAMAMRRAAERAPADRAPRPAVRIAIHTAAAPIGRIGELAQRDRDATREAETLLAELIGRAPPNTIVVSEAAAAFLERRFELVPADEAGPVPAYRLAGRERTGFGFGGRVGRFVGRRQELARLQERLATALGGHGQVVGIAGEAGIGKSRLVYEFRRTLGRQGVAFLRARCTAHTQTTALAPLLDIVRTMCRVRPGDRPEVARGKLERVQAERGVTAEHRAALLEVLGLGAGPTDTAEPEARRQQTFEALAAFGRASVAGRPLVIVIDDLHWVDRSTEEFLAGFLRRLAAAPVMFIFTYRPEYVPPWAARPEFLSIALEELGEAEAAELLDALLPAEVPAATRRLILERARGNPFFLEEQAWAAGEAGARRPLERVPDTIQGVLMARIDRLPAGPKRLLQTASVLGRDVSLRLLEAISPPGAAVEPHLGELLRHGFLYERTSGEEPVYAFKHALTQEVAYGSLPEADRRALHAAAGRGLEGIYADRLHEVYDRLAYHYARTDAADRAVLYLTRFAKRAARISAHAEAVDALQQALVHIERLPASPERDHRLVDLVLRQARSLFFLGRVQESLALLRGQADRLARLADPALAGRYYFLLGRNWSLVGDSARAVECARRAIAEAKPSGDEATLGKAYYLLAREAYWAGSPQRAIEEARQAITLLARTGERVWLGQTEWVLGVSHGFLGEFEPALAALTRVEGLGQALGDSRLASYAASTIGSLRALAGDREAGIAACHRGADGAPDPLGQAVGLGYLGYAYLESGEAATARPLLEGARRQLHEFGFRQMEGLVTTWLAEACLETDDVDQAAALAETGLEIARTGGYGAGLGFALRTRGRIAAARGARAEGARGLGEALATFAQSGARFEVGRTHLALAELAGAAGDTAAAARHLGEAWAAFRALGVAPYEARAGALAARLGLPRPDAAP